MTAIAFLLLFQNICGPVIISEVMVNPQGSDSPNEFVEIVNVGDVTINLAGWTLADLASVDALVGSNLLLDPGQRAIILEADYLMASGVYQGLIPPETLVLSVADNSIGNDLGNAGDRLRLINPEGVVVDSVEWGDGIEEGYSLERVLLDLCLPSGNWRLSNIAGGTPGTVNSVDGKAVDLALLGSDWRWEQNGSNYQIDITIANLGLIDAAGDLFIHGTRIATVGNLAPGDTVTVALLARAKGSYRGIDATLVTINAANDYIAGNDSLLVMTAITISPGDAVINEIMYTPRLGEPEWVEIANTTADTINLENWLLADLTGDAAIIPMFELPPNGLIVLSAQPPLSNISTVTLPDFPRLNNDGDEVILADWDDWLVDSVNYATLAPTAIGQSRECGGLALLSNDRASWIPPFAEERHTAGRANGTPVDQSEFGVTLMPNSLDLDDPRAQLAVT